MLHELVIGRDSSPGAAGHPNLPTSGSQYLIHSPDLVASEDDRGIRHHEPTQD